MLKIEDSIKVCLYCKETATTKDHVPPKSLLEKPFPNNLLTIPACKRCNQSFSLDEEYFLNVLCEISSNTDLLAKKSPNGNVYKARLRSPKLNNRIESSLCIRDDGRVMFQTEFIRIKRVIEKIALGLYFSCYKRKSDIKLFNCSGFYAFEVEETRPADIFMLTYSEIFKIKKWHHLQKNVFSYIIVRDWRRENKLSMIIQFHNTAWAIVEIPYPSSNTGRSSTKIRCPNISQLELF